MDEYKKAELNADDVILPSSCSLVDLMQEARNKALQEGIKANTVVLDANFAKINGFELPFFYSTLTLPPMICGLECRITKGELPEGYSFSVLEVPTTEREALIAQTRQSVAKEIFSEIEALFPCDKRFTTISKATLTELKKKYTERE